MTTPSNLTHVVSAEPGDDHTFQHGQSIGSFRSDMKARTPLNQIQFAPCRRATPTQTRVAVDDEPAGPPVAGTPNHQLQHPQRGAYRRRATNPDGGCRAYGRG